MIHVFNKNVDIKFSAHDAVSEITFISYAQHLKIGKPNNLKLLGTIKPKGLNRIAAIC
jgi:predicted transcriptional regulator